MIKLKPIVNEILLNEDEQITWGQVAQMFDGLKKAQNKETGIGAVKGLGKIALSLSGVDAVTKALEFIGNAQDYYGSAKALFSLGKNYSSQTLKNPKASEFKKLTGPFWAAIKLSPEISTMLDDNIETMFINQVLLPKLEKPGAANEPIPNMDELLGKWLNDKGLSANADIQFKGKSGDLSEATMNAEEMTRHKKKLEKLKKILATQGDQMMAYPKSLPNTVLNAKLITKKVTEDLRDWFGTGGKGGVGGGGWDRYNSSGDRIGKCGDAKEGEAYSACLSKEKAEKLGKEGRAAFVKRKRAAQSKGGDAKKGGERKKGQKPIKVKTGVKENLEPSTFKDTGKSAPYGSGYTPIKELVTATEVICDKCKWKWKIAEGGKDPYLCHKCHHDNTPNLSKEEQISALLEKNIPTDKSKWSYYKSQAKKKFDVYPSAYANAWAAKMYKKAGGGWRKSK